MKKLYLVCLLLIMTIVFYSCKEDSPLSVSEYNLPVPANTPLLNQSVLGLYGNYGAGYQNGNIRSNQATVSWEASQSTSDFLCYKVFLGSSSSPVSTITDPTTINTTLVNLNANTLYKVKVATVLTSGTSKIDTFTIKTPKFSAPSSISALPSTKGGIKVTWTNNAESATSFIVERTPTGSSTYTTLGSAVLDSTQGVYSYLDPMATNGTSYYYRVRATNAYETTSTTTSASAYYFMDTPVLTLAQVSSKRSINIRWSDGSNAETGYKIYRSPGYNTSWQLLTSTALLPNITSYTDNDTTTQLLYDSTYSYKIEVFNDKETNTSLTKNTTVLRSQPIFTADSLRLNFSGSSTKTFNITNTGNTQLNITGITVSNSRIAVSPSTAFSITAGSSRQMTVSYVPSDTLLHIDTITITHNAIGSPIKIIVNSKSSPYIVNESFESVTLPSGWYTSSYPWVTTTSTYHSGARSLKSGALSSTGSSYVYTNTSFTGTKRITFSFKTSSYTSNYLYFIINGSVVASWSGVMTTWQDFSYDFTGSGADQLEWYYSKGSSTISGNDAVYIDDVQVY